MIDVEQTIISQYANSYTLTKLVQNMNAYIDPTADIDNFFNVIFNVETAIGFGLDIWGRIVDVSRDILTTPITTLDDDAYRSLIYLKALSNISLSTNPAINQLMRNWLGLNTRSYVNDLGNMMIRYMFEFRLQPYQIVIITQSGIFLRPAGVGARVVQTSLPVFGFKEMGTRAAAPFGQAPFIAEDAVYAVN